jgi:hypothetical protein
VAAGLPKNLAEKSVILDDCPNISTILDLSRSFSVSFRSLVYITDSDIGPPAYIVSWASQPGACLRQVVLEADAPPLPRGAAAFQRLDCPLNCTSRARSSKLYIGTSDWTFLSPDLPRCNLAVRFSALIAPGDEELRALVYST